MYFYYIPTFTYYLFQKFFFFEKGGNKRAPFSCKLNIEIAEFVYFAARGKQIVPYSFSSHQKILDKSGQVWTSTLNKSGQVWTCMDKSGHVWGLVWINLDKSGNS